MYDQLNPLGVCLSYDSMLKVQSQIGDYYEELLVDEIKKGHTLRFIGDNLNFMSNVSDERKGHHSHMVHMFANAALGMPNFFTNEPKVPQVLFNYLLILIQKSPINPKVVLFKMLLFFI